MSSRRVLGLASDDPLLRALIPFTSTSDTERLGTFGRVAMGPATARARAALSEDVESKPPRSLTEQTVDRLQQEGNQAFKCKELPLAIRLWGEALEESQALSEPLPKKLQSSRVSQLLANRSLAYLNHGDDRSALADAEAACDAAPGWPKAYYRLGCVLMHREQYARAHATFKQGFALDPSNDEMQKMCEKARSALAPSVTAAMGTTVAAAAMASPQTSEPTTEPSDAAGRQGTSAAGAEVSTATLESVGGPEVPSVPPPTTPAPAPAPAPVTPLPPPPPSVPVPAPSTAPPPPAKSEHRSNEHRSSSPSVSTTLTVPDKPASQPASAATTIPCATSTSSAASAAATIPCAASTSFLATATDASNNPTTTICAPSAAASAAADLPLPKYKLLCVDAHGNSHIPANGGGSDGGGSAAAEVSLVVTLPLCNSPAEVDVEVNNSSVTLEAKGKYAKLYVSLPHMIDDARANAFFSTKRGRLTIKMPVVTRPHV